MPDFLCILNAHLIVIIQHLRHIHVNDVSNGSWGGIEFTKFVQIFVEYKCNFNNIHTFILMVFVNVEILFWFQDGKIIDSFTLIKDKHGPYA